MSDPAATLEPFLKALASETRQRILFRAFANGQEQTVNQVAAMAELGQSTTSEHLAILKRGGLLQSRREGKEVYYRPDRTRILEALRYLTEMLTCCCPE